MPSIFGVILEEFEQELDDIRMLVEPGAGAKPSARARVAGANAAVLLLAATFEEFIRSSAREYARAVVAATFSYDKLPPKIAAVAWKRTMEGLARIHLDPKKKVFSRESVFSDAQTRFSIAYQFCRGDLTQDIYQDLIHNENNMRPQEMNSLFKVSNLGNICFLIANFDGLKAFFGQDDHGAAHGKLLNALEDFFDRRNQTAHAVRAMSSVSPDTIKADIDLLSIFAKALANTLDAKAPAPVAR